MKMHSSLRGGVPLLVTLMMLLAGPGPASAQQLGDLEGKAKLTDAERAQRDADKVYQWIRFHADKPLKPRPAAPAAATAPVAKAAAATAPTPAPKPRTAAAPVENHEAPAAAVAVAAPPPPPPVAAVASVPLPAPELLASLAPASAPVAAVTVASPPPVPVPEPQDEVLRLLERVEPEFPRKVLQDRGGGVVLVRFTVQPNGAVSDVESLKASSPRLVRGVLDAVARWRFAPIAKPQSATVEVGFRAE